MAFLARSVVSKCIQVVTAFGITAGAAYPANLCPEDKGTPQFDVNDTALHELCKSLLPEVRTPRFYADGSDKPLNVYEAQIGEFFNNLCYRDPKLTGANGNAWAVDKRVRDTGPYVAHRNEDNKWVGEYHGFHSPVVIWYSPDMLDWLEINRPEEGDGPIVETPLPDGAIIVKEMYTPPASRCNEVPVNNLTPEKHGIAYMVRDEKASWDGWFWGYFGMYDKGAENPNIDWPVPANRHNGAAFAGFGQYCVNCHGSAIDYGTFSSLSNIEGQKGEPFNYLSQDWFLTAFETDVPEHVPAASPKFAPIPQSTPLGEALPGFDALYPLKDGETPRDVAGITLPSQLYDNVWAGHGDAVPPMSSEYLTSDQCAGCHAAGSTGLTYDMTTPNPHGDNLINLSPYATWRSSPMGLAGRDPIFFAQLSSEEELHPESLNLIWNTCFGCHGIMGQRQFQLDKATSEPNCNDVVFRPDFVTSIPYDGAQTADREAVHYDPEHAKYGALARDGISCVACHRAVLTPEQEGQFADGKQNMCVEARQNFLNVDNGNLEGFAKTFTGSYLVSDPSTLFGPFENPVQTPMENSIGNIPMHDNAIASSEQCGTCHTVHLPVLWSAPGATAPDIIADTYEQTTYPEWLFSAYRTGTAAFLKEGDTLPHGAGDTPIDCVGCHMESADETGRPFVSKIASIQEKMNMPESDHTQPASAIDLEPREGFARHTLVGLNLFLIKMAQQFPDILGIPLEDPMLTSKGMAGLERTEMMMVDNAQNNTADISITRRVFNEDHSEMEIDVRVENRTGHKFPSGVSFRRAFIELEVFDDQNNVVWHSGKTNEFGVLVAPDGSPLEGELWYDESCNKTVTADDYQPHYQEINDQLQVQIYQEVKLNPGDPTKMSTPPTSCAPAVDPDPSANLTTSFLSICHTQKDNRLLPKGLLSYDKRVDIAKRLGLTGINVDKSETQAEMMADEVGPHAVDDDPAYFDGSGSDTVRYRIPVGYLPPSASYSARATLHYQATPPFYLQDRFCTGKGANRDRLYHLSKLLDTSDTPIEDWKFKLVSTGLQSIGAN